MPCRDAKPHRTDLASAKRPPASSQWSRSTPPAGASRRRFPHVAGSCLSLRQRCVLCPPLPAAGSRTPSPHAPVVCLVQGPAPTTMLRRHQKRRLRHDRDAVSPRARRGPFDSSAGEPRGLRAHRAGRDRSRSAARRPGGSRDPRGLQAGVARDARRKAPRFSRPRPGLRAPAAANRGGAVPVGSLRSPARAAPAPVRSPRAGCGR